MSEPRTYILHVINWGKFRKSKKKNGTTEAKWAGSFGGGLYINRENVFRAHCRFEAAWTLYLSKKKY